MHTGTGVRQTHTSKSLSRTRMQTLTKQQRWCGGGAGIVGGARPRKGPSLKTGHRPDVDVLFRVYCGRCAVCLLCAVTARILYYILLNPKPETSVPKKKTNGPCLEADCLRACCSTRVVLATTAFPAWPPRRRTRWRPFRKNKKAVTRGIALPEAPRRRRQALAARWRCRAWRAGAC